MAGLGNIDDVYKHYLKVIEENKQFKEDIGRYASECAKLRKQGAAEMSEKSNDD